MEARRSLRDRLSPPPLRAGAADQAAETLALLRSWAAGDPSYDQETWALLHAGLREEPLSLAADDDHADRSG